MKRMHIRFLKALHSLTSLLRHISALYWYQLTHSSRCPISLTERLNFTKEPWVKFFNIKTFKFAVDLTSVDHLTAVRPLRPSMRIHRTSTLWQTTCTETWWLMERISVSSSGECRFLLLCLLNVRSRRSNIALLCDVLFPFSYGGIVEVVRAVLGKQWLPNTSWVTFPKYPEEGRKFR